MPRLSLYRPEKTNDYKFFDRNISEQFSVGGLDIHIHKYLGVKIRAVVAGNFVVGTEYEIIEVGTTDFTTNGAADNLIGTTFTAINTGSGTGRAITTDGSGDATQPTYNETNPLFIEDILFLENRNRDYEEDIYTMRGVYRINEIDFELSQFGLFLQNDTIFITFHFNDMIESIGRKLMNGDVLEFPNLTDFYPLDANIPVGLPRFYVINDANFAAEGFSQTWLPHLWRVKAIPLVGGQEYADILEDFIDRTGGIDGDDEAGNGSGTLADYLCQHAKNLDNNNAMITQAEDDVPLSGYDVSKFYIVDRDGDGVPITVDSNAITVDSDVTSSGGTTFTEDYERLSTVSDGYAIGYLTGDSLPPNGQSVTPGVSFPLNPTEGDYALRLDYKPNRLFRFNGNFWVHIEDDVRTPLTPGADNLTSRSNFVNNTDTIETSDRGTIPSRQSLSELLEPKDDN